MSDMLRTIWSTDTVVFEDKYIHDMDIVEPGISGEIFLQTLNSTSIQVIVSLQCIVTDISDISGDEYTRDVVVQEYEVLYSLPVDESTTIDESYDSYQDVYEIDPHHLTINIEDCIVNAIKSQEPIVKIKNDETLWEWWIEVVDLPPL